MSRITYPTLAALLEELSRLDRERPLSRGAARIAGGGVFSFTRGRDVGRLTWPGAGTFWLDRRQQEVVAVLISAYLETERPDVGERYLLRAAGSDAARLADVFAGSAAWGALVVPGRGTATYRVPPVPDPPARGEVTRGGGDEEG